MSTCKCEHSVNFMIFPAKIAKKPPQKFCGSKKPAEQNRTAGCSRYLLSREDRYLRTISATLKTMA